MSVAGSLAVENASAEREEFDITPRGRATREILGPVKVDLGDRTAPPISG
jgi:hypothetical protein